VRQDSDRKPIYLAVLASVESEHRDVYVALANKLNYRPQFPHGVIEKALVSPNAPQ
jgi:hypothetical protein